MKSNILILGNITNTNQSYDCYFFFLNNGNINVILGPQAAFDYSQINKHSLIYYSKDTFVLYPGCTIKTNDDNKEYNDISNNLTAVCNKGEEYITMCFYDGNLYLNRYVTEKNETNRNKLVGSIRQYTHIIYPTTMEDINKNETEKNRIREEYALKAGDKYPYNQFKTTSYFPQLYWHGIEHTYSNSLGDNGKYHFEAPDNPIVFDSETKVLQLNTSSELAKYDVAFWNQCKVESGMYSFNEFVNVSDNTDKYINTDTLEDLFMDGKTYRNPNSTYSFYGLLNNMPNTIIYTGITGSKNIIIIGQFVVYGNINGFSGKFCIASGGSTGIEVGFCAVTNPEDLKSKISKQKFKYTSISDSGENLSTVIVKNEQFGNNINAINYCFVWSGFANSLDSNDEEFYNCFANDEEPELDYRDTINHINLYNEKGIKWDLSTIQDCFQDGSTYNPSKSDTPGLLNNIPINLLENEIKIDLIGDKQIKLFSDKDYDYVTLSGDNTAYTGTIIIPSNIGKICLKYGESKANINDGSRKYTAIQDNALQVLNEYKNNVKIYYNCKQITENSSPINLNNILVLKDERDVIANINKYNVEGVTWDLSTIENCFKDGDKLLNSLKLNKIYANLKGNKEINIKTNEKILLLLGDNKQYKGTITIPNNTTDIYLKTISKVNKMKYKNKTYSKDNIPEVTFHYIDKATLPITPSTSTSNTSIQQNNNINSNNLTQNQDKNKNEFKYTFDLKYSNEIKVDLKDSMSTNQAIVLEDNGLILNSILWLEGDNRDFKGILITPKNIKTVIFYPNSFCKVINPSGRKLKYKFVDEYGNTDDEYCSDCKYHNKNKYKEYFNYHNKYKKHFDEEIDNKFMKKQSSSDDENFDYKKHHNKDKYKKHFDEEIDSKFMKKQSSSGDEYSYDKKYNKNKFSSSNSSSSSSNSSSDKEYNKYAEHFNINKYKEDNKDDNIKHKYHHNKLQMHNKYMGK